MTKRFADLTEQEILALAISWRSETGFMAISPRG